MKEFFDYFQLAAVIFFLVVFLGRTVHMWALCGVRPFALGVGKKGTNRIIEIGFLIAFSAWVTEIFLSSLSAHVRLFPSALEITIIDSTAARIIGAVLVMAGLALFVWALRSFGDAWRVGIDNRAPGDLVRSGAFAFSRNPIFLFIDIYLIGTFLINGTVVFLLFSILGVIGMHYQILQEEQHLRRHYGHAYDAYCAETGRYITVLGRRKEVS